jgi:hypothetical protein
MMSPRAAACLVVEDRSNLPARTGPGTLQHASPRPPSRRFPSWQRLYPIFGPRSIADHSGTQKPAGFFQIRRSSLAGIPTRRRIMLCSKTQLSQETISRSIVLLLTTSNSTIPLYTYEIDNPPTAPLSTASWLAKDPMYRQVGYFDMATSSQPRPTLPLGFVRDPSTPLSSVLQTINGKKHW